MSRNPIVHRVPLEFIALNQSELGLESVSRVSRELARDTPLPRINLALYSYKLFSHFYDFIVVLFSLYYILGTHLAGVLLLQKRI